MADPTLLSNLDQTVVYQAENGTAYGPSDRISIQIPASPTKAFVPSEAYLSLDFQIDTNADISTTKGMFQLNPFTGIHSVIRDCYIYDGAGREVDSVRNYDVFAEASIPWEAGQDELALKSNQEGICYLSRPNTTPVGFDVENQLKSSYAAELYYQPPLLNQNLAAVGEEEQVEYTIQPRTQRFCFPLNTGLFRSNQVFPAGACNGLRIDLLLQNAQKTLGKIFDCESIAGQWTTASNTFTVAAVDSSQNPSVLDLFRRGIGVGSRIVLTVAAGPAYYNVVITNVVQTSTGVQIITGAGGPAADVAVGGIFIETVSPVSLPSWKITNVQLFVRETEIAPEMSEAMKSGATYQFISHYNVPQSMVAGSFNPTINWNVVPVNQCLSLFACPVDEVQSVWGTETFTSEGEGAPAAFTIPLAYQGVGDCFNQSKWLWSLESSAFQSGGQTATDYQWQIGTELEPSQPDRTLMKEVPQYLNYELKNSLASMGRQVYSFKLHSFDNDGDVNSNQAINDTDIGKKDASNVQHVLKRILYHRQFSLALAPTPSLVLSLIDKPVQLRLGTSTAFEHNHTVHLFVNHYRTAVLNPNGTQVVM